jgi:type IV pilus assembly protein PilC
MFFERRIRFFREDGSFDHTKFMDLLNKARADLHNKKKTTRKIKADLLNQQIIIGGVKPKEVWAFVNKLSNFLTSGIDLKTAFSIVSRQIPNPKLAKIITEVRENLDHGLSVSETLKMHAKYFDPLVISLIEVGEKTGTLPRVVSDLEATLLENIEIKAKIKGALIYPAILVFLALSMATFMLTFILPKITAAFIKTNVEIPPLTQFMMNLSAGIINHWILLVGILVGLVIGFSFFRRTYAGQVALGYISLRLPVFGFINRQLNVILFINSLTLLLDSGMLMLEALETTSSVVPNIHFKKDIIRIKNEVETGIRLSAAMGLPIQGKSGAIVFDNKFFPVDLVHMVSVGEETGTIGKSISKVGENYSRELRRYIANIMAALEPIIIVLVGAIVGVIILAIMMPFFQLGKVAKSL